jgi:hypothetical protein
MLNSLLCSFTFKGRRGRERMVVEFTTTHAISAYYKFYIYRQYTNIVYMFVCLFVCLFDGV